LLSRALLLLLLQEFHLHPKRFRTQMCQQGAACMRPLCFFAHTLEELRCVAFCSPS
jgi:hypothetical protein